MKLWRYYLKAAKDDVCKDEELYALAIDKTAAKEFEKTRDMSRFRKIVTDEDTSFVQEICNLNRDKIIEEHDMITSKIDEESGILTNKVAHLCVPLHEANISTDTEHAIMLMENADVNWGVSVPYELYTSEIREALGILEYPRFRATVLNIESGYGYPEVSVDEVGIFINRYGDTLSS